MDTSLLGKKRMTQVYIAQLHELHKCILPPQCYKISHALRVNGVPQAFQRSSSQPSFAFDSLIFASAFPDFICGSERKQKNKRSQCRISVYHDVSHGNLICLVSIPCLENILYHFTWRLTSS